MRLLSLPCSSGEEPYSAAIALLNAGIPSRDIRVDAVDISSRALAQARHGVYGKNSFRGRNLEFRERHFRVTNQGYAINPALRTCVRFEEGNLFDDALFANRAPYDFIFCRNLLIYFDRETQQRALERVSHLLSATGTLFVGAAEHPVALAHGFVSDNLPMTFACHKVRLGPAHAAGLQRPAHHSSVHAGLLLTEELASESSKALQDVEGRSAQNSQEPRPAEKPATPAVNSPAKAATPAVSEDLVRAQRLADAGRISEAAAICEQHLRLNAPSAQAYYLLGLVREAGGQREAGEFYRKALYLQPDHYEALLHMALLSEKNGETAAARAFRRRAQRVRPAEDLIAHQQPHERPAS
jgi:chemotaxis protein methyltransferase WspC